MTDRYHLSPQILDQFSDWFTMATATESNDPNAMALATAVDGVPSVRIVLMKDYDARGWVFYTNLGSRKAVEIGISGRASLLFHWKSLRRQVRLDGAVEAVAAAQADAYFATRPRASQIGAWASDQSAVLDRRETLEARVAALTRQYHGQDIPRPPHWSGFRLRPERVEFWRDERNRLHRRDLFRWEAATGLWHRDLLYP